MVLALKEIIESLNDKASVEEVLSRFNAVESSSKAEVEDFLHHDAYRMELDGQSVTYLITNDEAMSRGDTVIDGYFTIAVKTFQFSGDISKRTRRKLSGKKDSYVPAYLIGQLAKGVSAGKGDGKAYLQTAIGYIKAAINIVGGRLVYLDCNDELVEYYEKNEFKFLQKNEESGLNQMYLVL